MKGPVLVINAGSSSIKFSGYAVASGHAPDRLFNGEIDNIGTAPHLTAVNMSGSPIGEKRWSTADGTSHESLFEFLIGWMEAHLGGVQPVAVGHRVVHGGAAFSSPKRIDDAVMATLQSLCPLAPLHQPHNLAAIRAIAAVHPAIPQVACFDTAFHLSRPAVAQRFALPRELHDSGLRRYGFHGLSYQYIASALRQRAPAVAAGRVVVAHLGAGASMCAMLDGKSIDTTMSFTALDGLAMATRCGALDPGAVLFLLRQRGMDVDRVEQLLYHESGLVGVSGISADLRELLGSDDPRAGEAVDLFVYRIVQGLGALAATLGGLDGLVFTAGIGEHSAEIRRRVCDRSSWLGIRLDQAANAGSAECISDATSRVSVWAIPTDEERIIVEQTIEALGSGE